ncbi:MAG: hypothetical protein WAN65_18105 [Candidatus Sulfotelmatobacter sp.]
MIRATIISGKPTFVASVKSVAVYLDNWAVKTFAKNNPQLGERFIRAIRSGGDILFSTSHAIEALGPQDGSSDAFKSFLNQVGPHWYPIAGNIFAVLEREQRGMSRTDCAYGEELLTAYFQTNTASNLPGSGKVIDLSSESFFKFGNVIDFSKDKREYLLGKCAEFDRAILEYVTKLRVKSKKKPAWLDIVLPAIPFTPSSAASFAFVNLMRELIKDTGYQIKKGDAMDLQHAVMATAFSNFAALDKQWKRRVENLPKPNQNPRVYYEPELEMMVTDIEAALAQLNPGQAS